MKTIGKKVSLLVLSVALVFISCSKDDDPKEEQKASILGTWIGKSAELKSINEADPASFFEELRETLINSGISGDEVETLVKGIEESLATGFSETFQKTSITFKDGGTFETTDGQNNDTGTWEFDENEEEIVLDKGTEKEFLLSKVSLTSSKLEGMVESKEFVDVESDGSEEELTITYTLNYDRSSN